MKTIKEKGKKKFPHYLKNLYWFFKLFNYLFVCYLNYFYLVIMINLNNIIFYDYVKILLRANMNIYNCWVGESRQ